ncbi:MAG: peroxiredoxin [Parasphingorhabdus sp.]|uniref:peroxiredoxin n=1 Tax=Parasphingorhabdus sp. TaxID=2709688 RepID=UPI003298FF5C
MIDVGEKMPDMDLTAPDGRTVKLSDYHGKKLVLFFYPKASTPGCTTESKDFSALLPEFEKAGTAILGMSADSPKRQQNFINKQELTVDIASDESTEFLENIGVWAEKKMYGKTYMGIIRSTFLIGADGTILHAWPKVKVKGHAEEVLAAAQAA